MSTEILTEVESGSDTPEFQMLSGWTKFTSIIYFAASVILLVLSVFPFFIKRTEGFDNRLISGAFPGSVQLFFFISAIVLAVIFYLLGKYLLNFSNQVKLSEISGPNDTVLSSAVKTLKKYFILLGLFTFLICFAAFAALLIGITL